jgi:hypothetical protein
MMVADFYIIPESFKFNKDVPPHEIEEKIRSLMLDFIEIKKYRNENKIFVHADIYSVHLLENITIGEFLFEPQKAKIYLDRDASLALRKIIVESEQTDISIQEVKDILLPSHTKDKCYGFISFNQIEDIDPQYLIIYNLYGWYMFRRRFLALYPQNSDYYIDECKKYFPNLYFHARNKNEVKKILSECPRKIIEHLEALNDQFQGCRQDSINLNNTLSKFNAIAKLDEDATLEGNITHKKTMTFDFINDEGKLEIIYCEAHLKLCYNDNYPNDRSYSTDRRIYFHPGKANIENGKILIGHIGKHL